MIYISWLFTVKYELSAVHKSEKSKSSLFVKQLLAAAHAVILLAPPSKYYKQGVLVTYDEKISAGGHKMRAREKSLFCLFQFDTKNLLMMTKQDKK